MNQREYKFGHYTKFNAKYFPSIISERERFLWNFYVLTSLADQSKQQTRVNKANKQIRNGKVKYFLLDKVFLTIQLKQWKEISKWRVQYAYIFRNVKLKNENKLLSEIAKMIGKWWQLCYRNESV